MGSGLFSFLFGNLSENCFLLNVFAVWVKKIESLLCCCSLDDPISLSRFRVLICVFTELKKGRKKKGPYPHQFHIDVCFFPLFYLDVCALYFSVTSIIPFLWKLNCFMSPFSCFKEKVEMQGNRKMGTEKTSINRRKAIRERKMALLQDVSIFDSWIL